MFVYLGVM